MTNPESESHNLDLLIALIPNDYVLEVLNGDKEGEISKEDITATFNRINDEIDDSSNDTDRNILEKAHEIFKFIKEGFINDNEKIEDQGRLKDSIILLSLSSDDDLDIELDNEPTKESPKLVTEEQLKIVEQIIKTGQDTTKEQFVELSDFLKSLNEKILSSNPEEVQTELTKLLEILESLKYTNNEINNEITDLKSTLKSLFDKVNNAEESATNMVNLLKEEVFKKIDEIVPLHPSISEYDLKAAQDSLREYEGETETFIWND